MKLMQTLGSGMVLAAAIEAGSAGRAAAGSYGDDVAFLKKHTQVVELSDREGRARVALTPALQGRVMTSTASGDGGASFGWINRELIASGKFVPHINVFGGEDRFWMGPEGGQYSIFFAKGAPFDLEHWFTPAPIDTDPYRLVSASRTKASFEHTFSLTNYSEAVFRVKVNREVRLLSPAAVWQKLGCKPAAGLQVVAFESDNKITNVGKQPWRKETGLLSIWILGMFNSSPATTVVVPIKTGPASLLGPEVTSDYFGPIPPERLAVRDGVIYFRGDSQYRSKIGVGPKRCKPILGSYDAQNKVLTLVQFTFKEGVTDYVNSLWKIQDDPYGGDVVNSYNDGPAKPGAKPFGAFYELETSSPAAALAPGKSLRHVHRTIHLIGPDKELDAVARATLGVGLKQIATALPPVN
ncbi:MAG: hypothetical protein N3I86_07310 [Verrucomicrobiae bacterium]|nr:hypothetical protein [Verrucomicrobiae bacterium]